jgi:hypothetical protein
MSHYQLLRQDGIELLVSAELATNTRHLSIDLRRFLVFRNLKAAAQLHNGLELGHGAA